MGGLRAQVEVLGADKAMLEERLSGTSARLAEAQGALHAASRDLAGMQVWGSHTNMNNPHLYRSKEKGDN